MTEKCLGDRVIIPDDILKMSKEERMTEITQLEREATLKRG